MPCVHDFVGQSNCTNCGGDAVAILDRQRSRLDRAVRISLAYLINGQRADAESELRAAIESQLEAGE